VSEKKRGRTKISGDQPFEGINSCSGRGEAKEIVEGAPKLLEARGPTKRRKEKRDKAERNCGGSKGKKKNGGLTAIGFSKNSLKWFISFKNGKGGGFWQVLR